MEIFVVGNLGSGKSTLIDGLAQVIPGVVVVPEKFHDNPILRPFVSNPPRFAHSLQLMFLVEYILAWEERSKNNPSQLTVIDAGAWYNLKVFTRNLNETGLISSGKYRDFEKMAALLMATTKYPEPSTIVHVITTPNTCLRRIKKRGRDFERKMSFKYLKSLDRLTHKMVGEYGEKGTQIITVDNEQSDVRDIGVVKSIAQTLKLNV